MKGRKAASKTARPAEAKPEPPETAKPIPTVDSWIQQMLIDVGRKRADAVHFEQSCSGLCLRIRLDGALQTYPAPEQSLQEGAIAKLKKMARMKVDDERVPRDGRFGAIIDSREIDFRVHSLPTSHGENLVLHVLDRATLVPLAKLELQPAALAGARDMLSKRQGLVLVVGPAGSGKTTTLYAMLNDLAEAKKKIVTIEDPIEFDLPGVVQSQVDARTGYDYPAALSIVSRQDPDVVMVGDLADFDTAQAALRTVLGGHLVLSSVSAADAAGAVSRLLGMGVDPFLLATGLEGLVEQRMVRRICPACKQRVAPSRVEQGWLGIKPGQKLARGSGCDECHGTGFWGQVGLFAVLPATEELRDLLLTRPQFSALRRFFVRLERQAMVPAGMEKVKAGLTTFSEVMRMGGFAFDSMAAGV